jgi:uncharacterized protein YbbC (DUF1343 family)
MKNACVLLLLLFFFQTATSQVPKVRTGIEVLRDRHFDILKGKRVGLITNPTGVDSKLKSTIDILNESKELQLVALFGPEHGVRGNFEGGDPVDTDTDPQTGVPAYSLYGKTNTPTPEMLKGIDVLVYDIQDIGCRSYTFISTMGMAMGAAADHNIEFVVLDRPNPLGGLKIEGNIVEKGFFSNISKFPIPYVYGLTCGELARLLNEEGMLPDGKRCKLTVVPMEGWKRDMTFSETGLPWVPTSPHIPSESSPLYYVSTGILGELQVISEGVGYTTPFHILAAEWIDPYLLASRMNALHLEGVLFRPIVFKPFYGIHKQKELKGVQIHITDEAKVNLMSIQFLFMSVNNDLYPDENPFILADTSRLRSFDKALGTNQIRKRFMERMSYDDIKGYLEKDVKGFRTLSQKYYLYKTARGKRMKN